MKLYLKPVGWGVAQTGPDMEYQLNNDPTQDDKDAMMFIEIDAINHDELTLPQHILRKDTDVKSIVLISNFGNECVHVNRRGSNFYVNDGRRRQSTSIGGD